MEPVDSNAHYKYEGVFLCRNWHRQGVGLHSATFIDKFSNKIENQRHISQWKVYTGVIWNSFFLYPINA